MATIDEQIKLNNAKIESNLVKIAQFEKGAAIYTADAQDDVCNQVLAKNRLECEAAKALKLKNAKSYIDQANVLKSMNVQLAADNKELTKQREAEAQAMIELSKLGTTSAAVQTKADAEADAARTIAESQGSAIETKATSESMDQKTKMIITIVVVLVVVAIASMILYKKFKKAKK